jgi:DNA-binding CsgD family transcriptional regulator
VIISSEQTSYGYRVSARGALRSEKADSWIAELRGRAQGDGAVPRALLIDARGLTWEGVSASVAIAHTFRRVREAGVQRVAVVTDDAPSLLEVRRLAIEAGAYDTVRFFSAPHSPTWERAAARWAADGHEEPQPRQGERRAELAHLLVALAEPLVLCDLYGRVLATNAAYARLTDEAAERAALAAELEALARVGVPRPGAPGTPPRDVRTARGAYRFRRHAAVEGLCGVAGVQLIAVERLVARPLSDAELRDDYGLTARELAVARLLAAGRTNAEIGEALGISPFTARNHAERVMAKLGVSNRARVAALLVAA